MAYNQVKVGEKQGHLTIIADTGKRSPAGAIIWLARCDCGRETQTYTSAFRAGRQCMACGRAITRDARFKHGGSRRLMESGVRRSERLYEIWGRMKRRCHDEKCEQYRWYGGKGVRVCEEWLDYAVFKTWALGHGYADTLTIDRRDSAGNYEPANCRWLTKSKNSQLARGLSRSAVQWNGALSFGC